MRRLWGIGPVAEEKLHRLGIDTIGAFAALSGRRGRQHPRRDGRHGPAPAGPGHRRAAGRRELARQADQRRIDVSRGPDDSRPAPRGREPDRRARPHATGEGRPRSAHGHRQAEEVRHEHPDPLGHAAVCDDRRGSPDRHRTQVTAGPDRDRPDSPCRRWLFGAVRGPAGIAVPGSGAGRRGGVQHPFAADVDRCRRHCAGLADRRRRRPHHLRARLDPGRRARRDDGAGSKPAARDRDRSTHCRSTPPTSSAPTRSTASTGRTTSTRSAATRADRRPRTRRNRGRCTSRTSPRPGGRPHTSRPSSPAGIPAGGRRRRG